MKIIAYYLPQFHETPENNKWWGEGYTEWTCLKGAKPLFKKHNQPKIPLNNYYYNLLDKNVQEWQVEIARKNGIYGFCIYHYWFSGKLLLEKPLENFLNNKKLKFHFCISWANEDWTNGWVSDNPKILIKQIYGDKSEWKKHFNYLLPFFKDPRYIKIDDSPIFIIYRPELIPNIKEMIIYWKHLAQENGLNDLVILSQMNSEKSNELIKKNVIQYQIEYQPDFVTSKHTNFLQQIFKKTNKALDSLFHTSFFSESHFLRPLIKKDYDTIWKEIIKLTPSDNKRIPGAFVNWDNTPRKKRRGSVFVNVTPDKFYNYLKQSIVRAKEVYKSEFLFIFAWNEWSEGGYLEPDVANKYNYLNAVSKALEETNELPQNNIKML